ncbi:MAG: dUTP diphosphatase [Cellvibrionales bacterium]|jgi:dimeric dUTPase (all-alpha-NTP-PPase superfamily)|nr:dUTP diphosphatase [Cellvibrionales bacterium]
MRQKLLTMLAMQDSMNTKVHPEWITQNYEWYRAVWIECGELMDHQGYKWWKKQVPDSEQVKLEIIDIWHFGMSAMFSDHADQEAIADSILAEWEGIESEGMDVHAATEALSTWCLLNKGFSAVRFWQLMDAAELDFETLYVAYVGKNVLNFFRQDNGYKDGSYIKEWDGREDNEHLVELSASLDSESSDFRDELYNALQARYQSLCG